MIHGAVDYKSRTSRLSNLIVAEEWVGGNK